MPLPNPLFVSRGRTSGEGGHAGPPLRGGLPGEGLYHQGKLTMYMECSMKRSTPMGRNIGAKVQHYRKRMGLTQKELAARLQVNVLLFSLPLIWW